MHYLDSRSVQRNPTKNSRNKTNIYLFGSCCRWWKTSRMSVKRELKKLQLKPYRVVLYQELKLIDCAQMKNLRQGAGLEIFVYFVFNDEAEFYLNEYLKLWDIIKNPYFNRKHSVLRYNWSVYFTSGERRALLLLSTRLRQTLYSYIATSIIEHLKSFSMNGSFLLMFGHRKPRFESLWLLCVEGIFRM